MMTCRLVVKSSSGINTIINEREAGDKKCNKLQRLARSYLVDRLIIEEEKVFRVFLLLSTLEFQMQKQKEQQHKSSNSTICSSAVFKVSQTYSTA